MLRARPLRSARGPRHLRTPRATKASSRTPAHPTLSAMRRRGRASASLVRSVCALLSVRAASLTAQQPAERPAWCANLPRPAYASLARVSVPSDWFEVYRVDPDVYAIYEPHQWQEVISYLIVGRER